MKVKRIKELQNKNQKLKEELTRKREEGDLDLLTEKLREVAADFNEIAEYFQKDKLEKLGDREEGELQFQSPGSKGDEARSKSKSTRGTTRWKWNIWSCLQKGQFCRT